MNDSADIPPATGTRPRSARTILWLIPISAVVIGALVAYKLTRPPRVDVPVTAASNAVRDAPLFQLYDERSQIVRLQRYIGRHKLLIVFFDAAQGAQHNPLVQTIQENYTRLAEGGTIVLAISTATPYAQYGKRDAAADESAARDRPLQLSFPLLSDVNHEVHRAWGAFDAKTERPLEAVFIVNRAGSIRKSHLGPDRLGTIDEWEAELRSQM